MFEMAFNHHTVNTTTGGSGDNAVLSRPLADVHCNISARILALNSIMTKGLKVFKESEVLPNLLSANQKCV